MTSGVYLLEFDSGDQYIGKSNNILRRWDEHIDGLLKGTSSRRLLAAFTKFGMPSAIVLCECHADHIDLMESIYIARLKPTLNHAPPVYISEDDIDTLEDCSLLGMSTGAHIRRIEELERKLASLGGESKKDAIINSLALKLKVEREKSWWEKLFG